MTHLKNIAANHFSLQCICGHQALLPVSDVIAAHGEELHVDTVEMNARCSRCKTKGMFKRFQIIYVGQSDIAMLGSDVQKKKQGNL